MTPSRPLHAFTVDVEDWFHILDCPQSPSPDRYGEFESRVVANTTRALDLLDDAGVRGTFFFLGWVAERHPDLVRSAAARGHEIAVHGFAHVLAGDLSDAALAEDIRRAVGIVGDAAGVRPVGYRSPGGSLLPRHRWVLDLLIELGLDFDSSIYPRPASLAEQEGFPVAPYPIHRRGDRVLWEYPSTIRRVAGVPLAFAEGGYLRLLPYPLVTHWFRRAEAAGLGVNLCVHPREFDPEHPRMDLGPVKQWKTRVGLRGLSSKVERLLTRFRFVPMGEALACYRAANPAS